MKKDVDDKEKCCKSVVSLSSVMKKSGSRETKTICDSRKLLLDMVSIHYVYDTLLPKNESWSIEFDASVIIIVYQLIIS